MKTYFALGDLIERLKLEDPAKMIKRGFGNPHSYRGDYTDLAFEPTGPISIGDMLLCAEESLGTEFIGYKGGEFTMNEGTNCWIAKYGSGGGQLIGEWLIDYMLADEVKP
jgi:hypothetical protein